MTVYIAELIARMEQPLRLHRNAGNRNRAKLADGEEGTRKLMPAATERCLSSVAVVVDHERMNIDPAPTRGDEFHTVRSPVGLDGVAHVVQYGQDLVCKGMVDIKVDISVGSGLVADQSVDAPTALEPIAAPNGADCVEHREHLLERHCAGVVHPVILTGSTLIGTTHRRQLLAGQTGWPW